MNEIERLQYVADNINKRNKNPSIPEKIILSRLELLKKHPEYEGKFHVFEERDIYATSSRDTIICVEVGRIKQR